MKKIRSLFPCLVLTFAASANAQIVGESICTSILQHGVRDERQIQRTVAFRESMKAALCTEETKQASRIKGDAASLGISFADLSNSLGLSASQAESDERLEQEYSRFCSDDSRRLAMNASLHEQSSLLSAAALQVYDRCVRDYLAAVVRGSTVLLTAAPDSTYEAFSLKINYNGPVSDPLTVDSYTRLGDVQCFRLNEEGKSVPVELGTKLPRNTILSCVKDPSEEVAVEFQLVNTDTSNRVVIPDAPNELGDLRTSVEALYSRVDGLSSLLRETNQSARDALARNLACRVHNKEAAGSSTSITCPNGTTLAGGGCRITGGSPGNEDLVRVEPSDSDEFHCSASSEGRRVNAYAICCSIE